MIDHIPELMNSGINSFKIEGRMKSAYYTAVVTNAYRMAMDAYAADPEGYAYRAEWMRELESVSHREYCTGYYLDDCRKESNLASTVGYIREKAYFAIARPYNEVTPPESLPAMTTEQGTLAFFKLKNKICAGDRAELLTPGQIGKPFVVQELYDAEGNPIPAAPHPSQPFYVRVPYEVKEGDILRAGE
jgi:putative protease